MPPNERPVSDFAPRRREPDVPALPDRVSPTPLTHEIAAEEHGRAVQRYLNMTMEIERLTRERDEWRRQAEMNAAEIERLEARVNDLTSTLSHKSIELEHDRDQYRNKLVRLVAQFEAAGSIVLKCLQAAQAEAGPEVNLRELSAGVRAAETARVAAAGDEEQEAEQHVDASEEDA